jgi:hypothetical protein
MPPNWSKTMLLKSQTRATKMLESTSISTPPLSTRSRLIICDGDLALGGWDGDRSVDPTTRGGRGGGQRASGSRPQLARIFQRHQRAPETSSAPVPPLAPGPPEPPRRPPSAAACTTAGIFRAACAARSRSHSWTGRWVRWRVTDPVPFRWVPTQ